MTTDITKKQLMAKARGFTISIEKIADNQRDCSPSGNYGDDYNKLRNLTAHLLNDLADILPPLVETYEDGGVRFTQQSYAEIDTYCEQIFQLLSEKE